MANFTRAYLWTSFVYLIIVGIFCITVIIGTAHDVPIARLGLGFLLVTLIMVSLFYAVCFCIIALPFFSMVTKVLSKYGHISFPWFFALIMGLLIGLFQHLVFKLFFADAGPYQLLFFLVLNFGFGCIFALIHYWLKRREKRLKGAGADVFD